MAHQWEESNNAIDVYFEVNEKCDLTADMALRLSRFTQTTPEMWLNLQLAIELWDAYHSPYAEKIEQIQPYATMCLA
jgi:plasmid maintenance system antidote protein VapI